MGDYRNTIGIIGRIDPEMLDGQTVKTRVLFEELQSRLPDAEFKVADFSHYKRNPLKAFFSLLNVYFTSDDIFILLSRNGRKVVMPIVSTLDNVFKRRMYYVAIGGNLLDRVEKEPRLRRQLKHVRRIWVEGKSMVEDLESWGFDNAEYLPNFKRNEPLTREEVLGAELPSEFKCCTMSRVSKVKGITEAIQAVESIDRDDVTLHIYGPVEESYRDEFEQLVENSSHCRYCGSVPASETVGTLSEHQALLFPTYWEGEGFPGTIIDGFDAGVPIIATRWGLNTEIVEDGVTGTIVEAHDVDGLAKAIVDLADDSDRHREMRASCVAEAHRYTPDAVMPTIIETICK